MRDTSNTRKVSAAVLVAVILMGFVIYFVKRTPPADSPTQTSVETQAADEERVEFANGTSVADPDTDAATETAPPTPVVEESPVDMPVVEGTNILRVSLDGITEEDARMTRVTLTGVDERHEYWPSHFSVTWPWQGLPDAGLTSEYDIAPFFAIIARDASRPSPVWNRQVDELEIKVCHPAHVIAKVRVPLSSGVELPNGQTIYEVRVPLVPGVPHVFWPELTLTVRDAHTLAHLENVELRCLPNTMMGLGQVPGTGAEIPSLGGGLRSPIALRGGRESDGPKDHVQGVALRPATGEALQLIEFMQSAETHRGVLVYVGAPGYAWGTIGIDVSAGGEHEVLLSPGAALNVRLVNVQLEQYAAIENEATLWVDRRDPDGTERRAWIQFFDETLVTEGLRLEGMKPAEYVVSVKLNTGSWSERPVLAREEIFIGAGETRDLVLALDDPPAPPELATLGGVVSIPAFGGEEDVRLLIHYETTRYGDADVELLLTDLERAGGALPTWSFRVENLPLGRHQIRLLPFLKRWIIELPVGGREDVELEIPELAEVLVETVDARTGERIPFDELRYRFEELPDRHKSRPWANAVPEEPGLFRFWTAPGDVSIWTDIPSEMDYGHRWKDLELVPGLQSVRFEFEPPYAIRFEFRDGETTLSPLDKIWGEVYAPQKIRAVEHEGHVTNFKLREEGIVEVSAPGVYDISFEGVGADRFVPIPPQRVVVGAGEPAEVIVELRRK